MKNKGELAPIESRRWTRPADYGGVFARRVTARRKREAIRRTQPVAPQLLLSTLPFLALIGALALLAIGIMVMAFPGNQPQHKVASVQHEKGVAANGWLKEAEKEFH
jgi:hypothetical protein